jgi:Putative Actinobacterial Holin-X, holin superfamily III
MALIQALIRFVTQTVGRILSALLDWAVVSLFGRVTGKRKLFLWGMMACAAAWPVLLAGVAAPKAALFVFAFVPLSSSVPPSVVRKIWLGAAVLVPIAVGATVGVHSPAGRREGLAKSIMRGFPIAAGLSLAFLVMLVTVPTLRVVSFVRGRRDTYVPLVTTVESYPLAAKVVLDTLERHGIRMIAVEPPWWAAMPSNILKRFGQGAFTGYTADQSAYFRSGDLEAVLYPNTLLLRGPGGVAARAHALAVEALTGHPDMFQTVSPDAQEIERQIQRVWSAYRLAPSAHANAAPLLSRFDEIALEIARRPLSFDDWQVIYRQVLQLGRALGGRRQILEVALPKETDMASVTPHAPVDPETQSLSTRQLLSRLLETVSLLVTKEVELARAEIRADVKAEISMVALLIAAGVVGVLAVNTLLIAAVFALAVWMPGWLAGLILAGILLAIGAVLALVGWQRRVSRPLAVTRKIVKEDVQWAKERLA